MNAEKSNVQQAMAGRPVASWASIFLDYFDSKARLLAVEFREATGHFIGLLVLLGVMLVLALCSVFMYGAFLLYLVSLLFHLAWGCSALICGAILTLLMSYDHFTGGRFRHGTRILRWRPDKAPRQCRYCQILKPTSELLKLLGKKA